MELIRKSVTVQKDGETKHYTNYYLLLENGYYIPVKPSFEKDYKSLYVIARDVTNSGKE